MRTKFFGILLVILLFLIVLSPVHAQSENQSNFISVGTIKSIEYEYPEDSMGLRKMITKVEIHEDGELKLVSVEDLNRPEFQNTTFKVEDRVIVDKIDVGNGNPIYQITDFYRTDAIIALLVLFIVLTIVVARRKGFFSLIGLVVSFVIIFFFFLQQIMQGSDPLIAGIISSIIIIPINFYLAHGFNRKTTHAIAGTILTLFITGLLSIFFVEWAKLSGYTSDEAGYLNALTGSTINVKDLLLAGVIVGILGILDDITISQASISDQLKKTNPKMKFKELFIRTMEVGKDHIASLVNTLILVYTSASLPLLLLFMNSNSSLFEVVNREVIAEEIVLTLLTSIGLILAVPISTFISAYFTSRLTEEEVKRMDNVLLSHHHH